MDYVYLHVMLSSSQQSATSQQPKWYSQQLSFCESHVATEHIKNHVKCTVKCWMEGHVSEKRCFSLTAIAATSPAPLPLPSSANNSRN